MHAHAPSAIRPVATDWLTCTHHRRHSATSLPSIRPCLHCSATVLFPIEMYRKLHRPGKWETIRLEALTLFCCLITVRWGLWMAQARVQGVAAALGCALGRHALSWSWQCGHLVLSKIVGLLAC